MANLQSSDTRWDDIRIFLAIHRHHTLAAAAGKLAIDTSTVSRRLAALEADLGHPLFERTRTGLQPTAAAGRVLAAAEAMEAAHARMTREASEVETTAEGIVRISTAPGLSSVFVAPMLVRLRKLYPRISIELDAAVAARDLTRHEADLAIRSVRSQGAELVTTKLVTASWVAAAAKPSPRSSARSPRGARRRGSPGTAISRASRPPAGSPHTWSRARSRYAPAISPRSSTPPRAGSAWSSRRCLISSERTSSRYGSHLGSRRPPRRGRQMTCGSWVTVRCARCHVSLRCGRSSSTSFVATDRSPGQGCVCDWASQRNGSLAETVGHLEAWIVANLEA